MVIALMNEYLLRTDQGYFLHHGRHDSMRHGKKVREIRAKKVEDLLKEVHDCVGSVGTGL